MTKLKILSIPLTIMILLSGCASVTIPPLMSAADKGDINAVNALLDKGADVNEWKYGTALTTASVRGNTDMVKLLIDRGADVNAMSVGGWSPLGLAAEHGHADIVGILIAKGADVDRAIIGMEKRLISVANYSDIVAKVKRGINLITNKAGWAYSSDGQHQKAISSFKKAISLNPSISSNFNGLSLSYVALKQYDEAITVLKRALELKPDDAVAYNNLGHAYGGKKQYDEAFKAFRKSMVLDPHDAVVPTNYGYFLMEKGDYAGTEKQYKRAVSLQPDNAGYLSNLADAYYKQGKYNDALATINKATVMSTITGVGTSIQVLKNYPVVASVNKAGSAEKAGIKVGDKIIRINGKPAKGWKLADVVSSLKGQEDLRVVLTIERKGISKVFEKELTREKIYLPEALSAIGLRSLIQRHRGKLDEALKDAEQAFSVGAVGEWPWLALGAARLDHGRYDDVKLLSDGIKQGLVKSRITARILEATAYARKGDFNKAIEIYSSIPEEELSQKNVPLWTDRTALLDTLKPFISSKKKSASALKAQGRHKEALKELGEAMKLADDAELEAICSEIAGIMAIDLSLSVIPEEARKYALRGDVMAKEGEFEEATKQYRKAVQAAPYIAELYLNTATYYGELKKYPQAIRHIKIYLRLAPEAPDARAAKDQIYEWEFMMEKKK